MQSQFYSAIFRIFTAIVLTIIFSITLAHLYGEVDNFLSSKGDGAVACNLILAGLIGLSGWWCHHSLSEIRRSLSRTSIVLWSVCLPLLVIGGAIILSMSSRLFWGEAEISSVNKLTMFYTLIAAPILEEIIFRVGFGSYFRKIAGNLLGGYFSALLFSIMHSDPTFQRFLSGEAGVLLGPFLLGIICEYLFLKTGRLMPVVLFHMACNSTVVVFMLIDSRWLNWLRYLYIG